MAVVAMTRLMPTHPLLPNESELHELVEAHRSGVVPDTTALIDARSLVDDTSQPAYAFQADQVVQHTGVPDGPPAASASSGYSWSIPAG